MRVIPEIVKADKAYRNRLFAAYAVVLLLLFILPSAYLIATGRRVIREGRRPHSGMKVIRDTVVSRGSKALGRGRILDWLGATSILLVAAGSSATRFIFYKFKTDPFFSCGTETPPRLKPGLVPFLPAPASKCDPQLPRLTRRPAMPPRVLLLFPMVARNIG